MKENKELQIMTITEIERARIGGVCAAALCKHIDRNSYDFPAMRLLADVALMMLTSPGSMVVLDNYQAKIREALYLASNI